MAVNRLKYKGAVRQRIRNLLKAIAYVVSYDLKYPAKLILGAAESANLVDVKTQLETDLTLHESDPYPT